MFKFIDGPCGYDLQSEESRIKYGFLIKQGNRWNAVLCVPIHVEKEFRLNELAVAKVWMFNTLDKNLTDLESKNK